MAFSPSAGSSPSLASSLSASASLSSSFLSSLPLSSLPLSGESVSSSVSSISSILVNQPETTPSSARFISSSPAAVLAKPAPRLSTDARHVRRNASACLRCSTSASAPLRLGTGGACRMVRISWMHRSRGTKKEVSGLNVSMSRRPCSGFCFASSSRGSRRKHRDRPPNFPSIWSALAPKGAPLCWGLSSAHSASMSCGSTSAMHGSRKSGFSESTQNSSVRRPSSWSSELVDLSALSSGCASRGRCGRMEESRAGNVRHSSTTVSLRSCVSGPCSIVSSVSRHGCSTGTTSRYSKSNLACARARNRYLSSLTYALGSSTSFIALRHDSTSATTCGESTASHEEYLDTACMRSEKSLSTSCDCGDAGSARAPSLSRTKCVARASAKLLPSALDCRSRCGSWTMGASSYGSPPPRRLSIRRQMTSTKFRGSSTARASAKCVHISAHSVPWNSARHRTPLATKPDARRSSPSRNPFTGWGAAPICICCDC